MTNKQHLPSPVTHPTGDDSSGLTADAAGQLVTTPRKAEEPHELSQALSSPPQDTQPLSQYVDPIATVAEEEEDEIQEGVWGYLDPLDPKYGDKPLVLKKRSACPKPDNMDLADEKKALDRKDKATTLRDEEAYERSKVKGVPSGGYLIGRHPECGKLLMKHHPNLVASS